MEIRGGKRITGGGKRKFRDLLAKNDLDFVVDKPNPTLNKA
jgi:hypothetical protein